MIVSVECLCSFLNNPLHQNFESIMLDSNVHLVSESGIIENVLKCTYTFSIASACDVRSLPSARGRVEVQSNFGLVRVKWTLGGVRIELCAGLASEAAL